MSTDHESSGKSRLLVEQAIDDAMEDLAQRNEARARRRSGRVRSRRERLARISFAFAVPALIVALVWNVTSVSVVAERIVGPTAARDDVEAALKVVVDDIEAFHDDYGDFPVSLAEVGLPTGGEWSYTRLSNERYRLGLSLGGQVVTHEGQ